MSDDITGSMMREISRLRAALSSAEALLRRAGEVCALIIAMDEAEAHIENTFEERLLPAARTLATDIAEKIGAKE